MPQVEWRHDGQRLRLPLAIFPSITEQTGQSADLIWGIIDTGATATGIRQDVVDRLGMLIKGKRRVFTANGDMIANEHLFRVGFYPGRYDEAVEIPQSALPHVLADEILGYALHPNFSVAAIIGMDIIASCDLQIRRSGRVTFSFD